MELPPHPEMQLPHAETQYASYIEAWKRRARAEDHQRAAAREQALTDARKIAALLVAEFGAAEVVLFGSLARGEEFRLDSDIDLAASGISPELFFTAAAAAAAQTGFGLDLVPLEDAPAALRIRIESEGVWLSRAPR